MDHAPGGEQGAVGALIALVFDDGFIRQNPSNALIKPMVGGRLVAEFSRTSVKPVGSFAYVVTNDDGDSVVGVASDEVVWSGGEITSGEQAATAMVSETRSARHAGE